MTAIGYFLISSILEKDHYRISGGFSYGLGHFPKYERHLKSEMMRMKS